MRELSAALERLGLRAAVVTPLAGDASHRRFFRVGLAGGGTVVACLYPESEELQAARDAAIQRWGLGHNLPLPNLVGHDDRLTVSQDLGDDDLERVMSAGWAALRPKVLDALASFQSCPLDGLPTPPFDALFWRRELGGFERFAVPAGHSDGPAVGTFLDRLAAALAAHPYRLVHRDFHVNNLFLRDGRVWAVDFQDMRAGPDTYDAASLLRERAGVHLAGDPEGFLVEAAVRLAWPDGWHQRYLECAAQRGLKVVGTFRRLAAEGRCGYLAWIGEVATQTEQALTELAAPGEVVVALRRAASGRGV